MRADTHPLYETLIAFPLDSAEATFPFSAKLCSDNGWTRHYTRRVLAEYRRFLFLAATSGHPVAPPDPIDQAWHLHMVYTRSYWDELCGATLGFPLHHGPTRGGQADADKFTDWYARTLESYRAWFGEEPPGDIWTPVAERFSKERNRFRRVNLSENWVIPKTMPRLAPGIALLGALCLAPLTLGASGEQGAYALLVMVLLVALLGVFLAHNGASFSARSQRRNASAGGGGADNIELASGTDHRDHPHPVGADETNGHGDSSSDSGGADGGGADGGSSGCGGGD
ncbi:MAG: hypothetical protein H7145_15850 [Akkermansiaceae bacterium]|nr:hypothetical protein [Armatimonadota bacterium]